MAGVARELLTRWLAGNPDTKLRLLGVVLTELMPAGQLGLFQQPDGGLDATVDQARTRFGSEILRRGDTV